MNRFRCVLLAGALIGSIFFQPVPDCTVQPFVTKVYAHGHHGGDSHHGSCGGSIIEVYYYCGGHEAHQHANGVCPYAGSTVKKNQGTSNSVKKSTVKKVQKKLKKLGYHCGKANGVMNAKTKKALKRFQKDHCLKVNGAIKKQTLRALGLKK